jgi:hypothetical protein
LEFVRIQHMGDSDDADTDGAATDGLEDPTWRASTCRPDPTSDARHAVLTSVPAHD